MALLRSSKAKQETTPGIWVSAGEISQDFDNAPWKELLKDYSEMRNGGAVESTTVSVLKFPMLRTGFSITHSNPEIEDYLYWIFESLVDSFNGREGSKELLEHMLLALEYGCSFFEKVYQRGVLTPDGKITNRIIRLAPFKPETIFEFYYDDMMFFSGIKHERRSSSGGMDFVDIGIDELFFYSHNSEYGDPRGRSEYRPARNLYKIKRDILLATARAQQRGAGIPEIKSSKAGLTTEEKSRLEAIGRSIGNMKNGYVITDADTQLILHSLQVQGSPEATLEFINRELFFNTLTEFMTSGIGQSGSRSATSEHKSSYELKFSAITSAIESRMNGLIRELVDISYFGPQTEYPVFQFNSIDSTDVNMVSESIGKLYERNILVKQEGDEEFIRAMFNMPEKIEILKEESRSHKEEDPEFMSFDKKKEMKKLFFRQVLTGAELHSFISKRFNAEEKENMYTDLQQQTDLIVSEVVEKYVEYAIKRVNAGEPLEIKYDIELFNRLNKLYQTGYATGAKDVDYEIAEAGKKELAESPQKVLKISQTLKRHSGKLLYNVRVVVEDILEREYIPGKTDITEILASKALSDGFKQEKRTLIEKVSNSYIEGRSDAIEDNKDRIDLFLYNSVLDKNLCDICAEWTGAVLTLEEAEENGFLIGSGRVNPGCLGGLDRCRCNLLVYKLKGDLE